jgi:hypothetical protein
LSNLTAVFEHAHRGKENAMSRSFQAPDCHTLLTSAGLLPLCLALAACGGGGGGVASMPPPPPTPTPQPTATATVDIKTSWLNSPATRPGNYGVIGRLTLNPASGPSTSRFISSGFTMSVQRYFDDDPTNYILQASAGILPGGLTSLGVTGYGDGWDISLNPPSWNRGDYPFGADYEQYFGTRFTAYSKPTDGSAETELFSYDLTRDTSVGYAALGDGQVKVTLDYDVGYSYVAMGEWAWQVLDVNGNPAGDSGSLLFVNGDRTPAGGIPKSGTATYNAHTLGASSSSLPFSLIADFGQRLISTEISQASVFDVSGSAPFSNDGSFDIPLNGTAGAQSATGEMDGAFFGPHAEQVGGVFAVESQGSTLMQDAFVGQQQPH